MKSNQSIPIIVTIAVLAAIVIYKRLRKKEEKQQKEQTLAGNLNIQPNQNVGLKNDYEYGSVVSKESYDSNINHISLEDRGSIDVIVDKNNNTFKNVIGGKHTKEKDIANEEVVDIANKNIL